MPFPMKIQPIDSKGAVRTDPAKPAAKSRLKRLIERQFPSVLRISSSEKLAGGGDVKERDKDGGDPEPSSVCLAKMVQNFLEESNEKPSRCGRRRCNCFHGNCDDSSDDDVSFYAGDAPTVSGEVFEILKGLVLCASVTERNLLADTSKIAEKNKICKGKDDCRRIVTDGLQALGYDASICKSRWEKSPSFPAGEYEYVDVIVGQERLLVDVDFRSEFEIARSTKNYRAILQSLPSIFIGKSDRLQQIVAVVSEAARQSLKKKGLHFPPWRKPEYLRAKWLSPYQRATVTKAPEEGRAEEMKDGKLDCDDTSVSCAISAVNFSGEFEVQFADSGVSKTENSGDRAEKLTVVVSAWQPPAVKPKASQSGAKVVAGLASALREKP